MNATTKMRTGISPARRESGREAFTLMELMVVVAIAAILAALALPAYQRATSVADKTGCVGNLRQIGLAINTYAADHSGILPYFPSNRMLATSKINNGESVTALSDYLGLPAPSVTPVISKVLLCPAWKRRCNQTADGPCYSNVFLLSRASNNQHFYPYVSPFGKSGASNTLPLSTAQLNSMSDFSPALQWAIQDCDQVNYTASSMPGLSANPVHQTFRNVLYFDWHIEQLPISVLLN